MTILDLLSQDGIQLNRVSNFHGGEYAGPCLKCGGRDRFRAWPEEGNGGKWWCRVENIGGDCIQYLRDIRGMSYKDACVFLGVDTEPIDMDKQPVSKPRWEPREVTTPINEWVKKCSAFVEWCRNHLWGDAGKSTLEWLRAERGLSEETIKAFSLGWNSQDAWRDRKAWGLPEEIKENGKPKKLWLPSGVVIPCFSGKDLQRARIRRQDPEAEPRYCIVAGSSTGPMVLGDNRRVFVIVESELDAILLHQDIGDLAGVVSLGNAQTRPDKVTAELFRGADLILIALDGDDPGAKEAWLWWPQHFQQARRLPPVYGKDPGEMIKAGVNLKDWVEIGIETEFTQNPEPTAPRQDPLSLVTAVSDGAELISSHLEYLAGIDDDLTGWTLWKKVEHGLEHRFSKDAGGVIRWERWYSIEKIVINGGK